MKVLIKGFYGYGNLGDDILMKVSYSIFKKKYPKAHFFIFSNFSKISIEPKSTEYYNLYIKKILGFDVTIIDWTYKGEFDLLVDGGGGIYFDNSDGGFLYLLRNFIINKISVHKIYLIDKILRSLTNKSRNIKYKKRIGLGIGISDFSKKSKSLFDKLTDIGGYDLLMVRDKTSYNFLEIHGFKKNKIRNTDLAFLDKYWKPEFSDSHLADNSKKKIGIILSDYNLKTEKELANFLTLSQNLRSANFEIHYFSLNAINDTNYINYFKKKEKLTIWDPNNLSLEDFFNEFRLMNLFITSRAHGAILGACFGIPSICLRITQKLETIFEMLHNSSQIVAPPFNQEELYSKVMTIINNEDDIRNKVNIDYNYNNQMITNFEEFILNNES